MFQRLRTLVVALAILALSMLALAPPAHADPVSDFASWVNNLRSSAHTTPLTVDSTLTSVAQQWANHMAATGVLAHNPSLSTQAPQGWTKMGENIGDGYNLTATYNALVNSPDHYANMVDPAYTRTGVGIATDAKGQVWVAQDFGAYPPPAPAPLTFPTAGTTIFPMAQTFSWAQATGALYYCVTVGTTQGGVDLVNSGLLNASQLSYPVPALPGGALWARIYTFSQGTWIWSDARFSVTGPSMATFTQPTNGATNVDTTQPFSWTPVTAAGYYAMSVGTTKGSTDVVNSGLLPGTQSSFQVPALPVGQVLWGRLYTWILGSWRGITDVSFTAAPRR